MDELNTVRQEHPRATMKIESARDSFIGSSQESVSAGSSARLGPGSIGVQISLRSNVYTQPQFHDRDGSKFDLNHANDDHR
jgi:hypothetical protein